MKPGPSWLWQAARWVLLVAALGALLGCALYLVKDNPRSFAVAAATRGVQVRVEHPAMSQWLLDRAKICFRRERPVREAISDGQQTPLCDPRLFEVADAANLEIFWPQGAEFRLSRTGPNFPMVFRLVTPSPEPVELDGRALTPADLVVVESADWLANSPLTMAGHVVVGSRPGPGETGNLLGGTYSVSERLPLSLGPVPITEGTLLSGDTVEILVRRNCEGAAAETGSCVSADGVEQRFMPAQSFGFIEPRGADDAGFGVTIYSEASESSLSIDRFGASGLVITPNWVHRAVGNPVLLAASALLAILSGLASLSFLTPLLLWARRGGRPVKLRLNG